MGDESDRTESVSVTMEVSGGYDDVLSKLHPGGRRGGDLEPFVDDVEVLLETLLQMEGGTRSAIAERLPAETTVSYDAEAVVEVLHVLERYELVVLEGNTWKPGPNLRT